MRIWLFSLAMFLALGSASTSAQDDDQVSPPPSNTSDDGRFIAYSQPVLAIAHAEIVDGTGTRPRFDQTLLVENGRIAAIGPSRAIVIPHGAVVIDGHGKTLLPGFVMMHEHLFYPTGRGIYASLLYTFPRLYLAGGTTTARTTGSVQPYADLNLKTAIEKGEAIGPDFDITGPYLNGAGIAILQMHVLSGPDDATRTVNYWADEGVTSYKAYITITRAELKAAIDAAHARGLKITGHLCSVTYREAAELGIDNLEHGFAVMTDFIPDKKPDICPPRSQLRIADVDENSPGFKSLIDLLVAHHVALTSTLTVMESFAAGRPEAPEDARALLIPELRKAYEDEWTKVQTDDIGKTYAVILPKLMRMEKMFVNAGGLLLAGTDPTGYGGVVSGFSAKRQVELLVEAGISFPQALEISSLNGARFMGRESDIGSLEKGKRADILVIEGDPMRDVHAIEHMPLVFKAGTGYRADAIVAAMKGLVGLY